MTIREWWRKITPGRYVHALETEVSRLRAENRALLNSILGIAGVPPVTVPIADVHNYGTAFAAGEKLAEGTSLHSPNEPATRGVQVAMPMRRRSWQQIMRAWELESGRKKDSAESEVAAAIKGRKG